MQLWPPCQKILVKTRENHLLESRKWWKNYALYKQNYFSSKCSSEHAQWFFGKPAVICCQEYEKLSTNPKIMKLQFFDQNFFFIKNYSLTTDNAILTTLPKIFLQKTTDLPLTFQEMTRKFMNFPKENCFSSNCASVRVECICDHPVKTFSSKLWKLFAGIPQMTKKW